jgi:hypothetical protein
MVCNGGDTNVTSRKRVSGAALEMGEGLPRSAGRGRPQTASVLLHPKGVVVSDRGKGAIKASGVSREDERKRTVYKASKDLSDAVKTAGPIIDAYVRDGLLRSSVEAG